MRTDIVPKEMELSELMGHLSQRDARVLRKIMEAMVNYNLSLPRALCQVLVFWDHKIGWYDAREFKEFEEGLDKWLELSD